MSLSVSELTVILPRLFSDFESLSELNAGECQVTLSVPARSLTLGSFSKLKQATPNKSFT